MTMQRAGAATALPFLLNPATVGVVAIGAVGWGLIKLLRDEDEEDETEAAIAAPNAVQPALKIEAVNTDPDDLQAESRPAAPLLKSAEEKECHTKACEAASVVEQKEIVRRAMSELGKRSAAARARRKAAAAESGVIGGE